MSKPLVFYRIPIKNLENEIFEKTSKLLNPRWWSILVKLSLFYLLITIIFIFLLQHRRMVLNEF